MMFCKICGGAIDPDVESINGTHAGMDYCVVILNARVNHEQARAEAAERRVAELEALLAGWVALKRGAIERREDVPWQALLVEFREPTAAERAYGETLISLLPPPTGENSR